MVESSLGESIGTESVTVLEHQQPAFITHEMHHSMLGESLSQDRNAYNAKFALALEMPITRYFRELANLNFNECRALTASGKIQQEFIHEGLLAPGFDIKFLAVLEDL